MDIFLYISTLVGAGNKYSTDSTVGIYPMMSYLSEMCGRRTSVLLERFRDCRSFRFTSAAKLPYLRKGHRAFECNTFSLVCVAACTCAGSGPCCQSSREAAADELTAAGGEKLVAVIPVWYWSSSSSSSSPVLNDCTSRLPAEEEKTHTAEM